MKFGVCVGTDVERVRRAKECGYDYVESGCGSISALTDGEFEAFCSQCAEIGIPVSAANGFFPKNIILAGPDSDKQQIRDYLNKLYPRAKRLGIKSIIFGSGGARRIPDGMSIDDGREEIIRDLKEIICPMAEEYGITIVIEPLRNEECNVLNSVHEGVEVMKKAGCKNLRVLADIYHMVCVDEPFDYLAGLSGSLVHAHTSKPIGGDGRRIFPAPGDGYDQKPFISRLVEAGVECCSVEAATEDFYNDAPKSLEAMRAAL